MGKIKLAEAYLEQDKKDQVLTLIKDGWINADIRKNDLNYYRAKFKKYLTVDDHIKRADYLAWETKYWDLKRMLRYLPKDEKALYNARQILMSNSYGVDTSIARVPAHLKKDIGLEYDRLRWRNRRGRLEPSLEILYAKREEELAFLPIENVCEVISKAVESARAILQDSTASYGCFVNPKNGDAEPVHT